MSRKRVVVIICGRSGEHEVSIVSARSLIAALDRDRWEVTPLGIARDGGWLTVDETRRQLEAGAKRFETGEPLTSAAHVLAALADCDVAFPLVHGTYGEDGRLQGLLDMAGVAYAGAGVAASAIGMDKALMKALFRDAGVPLPRYGVVRAWESEEDIAATFAEERTGYPCFVKPANGGSSVGVSRVRSREDLRGALAAAFAYDDKALIEEAIAGQEVEVSVLGNEQPRASVVGEIEPDREFYDYDSKYDTSSTTALHIPARISEATAATVQEMAIRMYQAMGCEGYARVDFFVRSGSEVIANEVNTIPGFTSISMYPKLWAASGLEYRDLLTEILDLGLARHAREAER
jgi:D-alanine-D-alanine ligase